MDLPLLNRKQLAGLVAIDYTNTAGIVAELSGMDPSDFTSINVSKSQGFDNYPRAHQHCYDTFFKGQNEQSLSSELYVQYSFTQQPATQTVSLDALALSGATTKARLRRLQKHSKDYVAEADDTQYTELSNECPASVRKLIDAIRATGDTVTRVRLAGLAPGHSILLHRDHDPTRIVRLHIPIATTPHCVIDCENRQQQIVSTHLQTGKVYILNTGRRHAARNNSDQWRVHLLIDIHGQNFLRQHTANTIVD